ncbi:MAG: ATP-binding protein [Candidatus Fimenecus sp.]
MKKSKLRRFFSEIRPYIYTYLLFFMLSAFTVTCSFLLFFHAAGELSAEEVRAAAPMTFINILLITAIFVAVNAVRRKITVDRPVRQIQDALKKITNGDFSVRLDTRGCQADFAEIMESINVMTAELSGVETLRTDFIADVSHEMKTPLAVIGNYGTLLQSKDLTEKDRMAYAKTVTDTARRLADLMTNILKLNRLENQQIYPQAQPFDLGEQLCEAVLQFESVWEQEDITLETDILDGISVCADKSLLEPVWSNLLSNAFKFTPAHGTVRVTLTADDTFAVVTVSDTGCGMTPQVGAHIFEKFYQGDTSHATQGNGLGLALVKRIMDITGGEISVSSAVGEGSTFTVKLRRNM